MKMLCNYIQIVSGARTTGGARMSCAIRAHQKQAYGDVLMLSST